MLNKRPVTQKGKKCKVCKQVYKPTKPLQSVCSPLCAIEHSKALKAKKEKVEHREAKEKLKSRSDWMREAQQSFNTFIRYRDNARRYGCISCGTKQGKENAGHYRSVGSSPELRFNEENCHLQCEKCNTYLHGNLINYRIALIQRIGLDRVEWIEGKHEPKKYTIDDLKSIKSEYKRKLKEITK